MLLYDLFRRDPRFKIVHQGNVLFSQGDHGEFMYVLVEGRATILVGDLAVEKMAPGSIAGEMAMLDSEPRTATVVADTDCRFAEIDRKQFEFLVAETPLFALQVMRVLAGRLREMDRRLKVDDGEGKLGFRQLRPAIQPQPYREIQ